MGNRNAVLINVGIHPGTGGRADRSGNNLSYKCSNSGKVINLFEDRPKHLPGYKVLKHQKTDGEYYSLYQGAKEFHGFVNLKNYTDVYVYFWESDDDYKVPLVIQLGNGDNYYISDVNSTTWRRAYGITSDALLTRLDQENCKKNGAHVMDIFKGKKGPYTCPLLACKKKIADISFGEKWPYTYSLKAIGSSITRFENEKKPQKGLPFPRKVDYVYVYFDLQECKIPLLIHIDPLGIKNPWHGYDGCKWYQKVDKDGNEWKEVPNGRRPSDSYESGKIMEILVEYLPKTIPEIEKVQRLEEPGSQGDSTPVEHPFTIDKITHLPHMKFGDPGENVDLPESPVIPYEFNIGDFDVHIGDRDTQDRKVTVDYDVANTHGDDLVTDIYTRHVEHGETLPDFEIVGTPSFDLSDLSTPQEVAENIESTGPVMIDVPSIYPSEGQDNLSLLEGESLNNIYRGYSGSPSITYGGDAVYESYTTTEYEEHGCIASDLEVVEESQSNYILFEAGDTTQVIERKNDFTPIDLSFPKIIGEVGNNKDKLPQSSGESSKLADMIYNTLSNSISGSGILVEEDYNTAGYNKHGDASAVEINETAPILPTAEINETDYKPDAFNCTINSINPMSYGYLEPATSVSLPSAPLEPSGVEGSPISDAPKGYFDPPPITSTVQGSPVAQMAEDAIDGEGLKEHLSVQGSSIAIPKEYITSPIPDVAGGVFGTGMGDIGEGLVPLVQLDGAPIPSVSIDPAPYQSPLLDPQLDGIPIADTTIIGESQDVTIIIDSSPIDFDLHGEDFTVSGSNSYQSTEETEPNLYSVEERFNSIIPESIQLDTSHISIDSENVVDIQIEVPCSVEQTPTQADRLVLESAIAGALGLQALRLVLETALVPTLVFAEHIFKSAADGILPKEPCPAVTPILPVCIADPPITCCWWWYLLWVIIVLLVIILVCVLCRRSIKVLIVKV